MIASYSAGITPTELEGDGTFHPHKLKRKRGSHTPHTIIYGTFTVGQPS